MSDEPRPERDEGVVDLGEHDRLRVDLGGYVLGSLTVDEQLAVERHLEQCDTCRAELAELEVVPVLLDLAHPTAAPSDADTPPAESPTAAPTPIGPDGPTPPGGPVAPVVPLAPRRRPARTRAFAGAAVALAVAAALVVGIVIGRPSDPAYSRTFDLQAVSASADSAHGSAALRSTDTGTAIRLRLDGLPTGSTWFECIWQSDEGDQSAGSFRPTADGRVDVDLTTAARLQKGWRLVVLEYQAGATDGEPILQATA